MTTAPPRYALITKQVPAAVAQRLVTGWSVEDTRTKEIVGPWVLKAQAENRLRHLEANG